MSSAEVRPSKKQRELLNFIDAFIAQHGYGPSYREIMRGLDYKTVSVVATHINNLIKKGQLRKKDHSARSLEVVKDAREFKKIETITPGQEKWLVDLITQNFSSIESNATVSQKDVDNLFVLVGALQVLGLEEAATSFKNRLIALLSKKSA